MQLSVGVIKITNPPECYAPLSIIFGTILRLISWPPYSSSSRLLLFDSIRTSLVLHQPAYSNLQTYQNTADLQHNYCSSTSFSFTVAPPVIDIYHLSDHTELSTPATTAALSLPDYNDNDLLAFHRRRPAAASIVSDTTSSQRDFFQLFCQVNRTIGLSQAQFCPDAASSK